MKRLCLLLAVAHAMQVHPGSFSSRAMAGVSGRPERNPLELYCKLIVENKTEQSISVSYKREGSDTWYGFRSMNAGDKYSADIAISKAQTIYLRAEYKRQVKWRASFSPKPNGSFRWTIKPR